MMPRYENLPAQNSLLDLLDHVLDKGLVVAGDIKVSLANVELLTIKIRLLVCSVDKAQEIGMDWWRSDRFLDESATNGARALEDRVHALEQRLAERGGERSEPGTPSESKASGSRRSRARTGTSRRTPRKQEK